MGASTHLHLWRLCHCMCLCLRIGVTLCLSWSVWVCVCWDWKKKTNNRSTQPTYQQWEPVQAPATTTRTTKTHKYTLLCILSPICIWLLISIDIFLFFCLDIYIVFGMYIFIMGLCTVSSLLLLLEKKTNVLALWIVLLPAEGNLESHLNQNSKLWRTQILKYIYTVYISLCRPTNYLSVNFILQYCLRYYFK